MQLCVRKAALGDEGRIAEIQITAWREAYNQFADKEYLESLDIEERKIMWASVLNNNDAGRYFVCELNHQIEGFCVFGCARDDDLDKSVAELVALNVSPDAWRKMVGTTLLSTVIDETTMSNYSAIYLWVIEGNGPAISLYEKFGFVSDGTSKVDNSTLGTPIREVRYVKLLR